MAESTECRPFRRDMLPNPVDVPVADPHLSLAQATDLAYAKTSQMHPEVMLLAWFHRQTGDFSPNITCCVEDKPAWLVYALSRGADLFITINREEFVFAYKILK
jgi:hypothetical protein